MLHIDAYCMLTTPLPLLEGTRDQAMSKQTHGKHWKTLVHYTVLHLCTCFGSWISLWESHCRACQWLDSVHRWKTLSTLTSSIWKTRNPRRSRSRAPSWKRLNPSKLKSMAYASSKKRCKKIPSQKPQPGLCQLITVPLASCAHFPSTGNRMYLLAGSMGASSGLIEWSVARPDPSDSSGEENMQKLKKES